MDTERTFGGVLPEKRLARIGEKVADVSRIPSRYTIQLMEATANKTVDYREIVPILAAICQKSEPEITADYIFDTLELQEINELIEYMMAPMTEKSKAKAAKVGEQEAKNP